MTGERAEERSRPPTRRIGYAVAIAVNVALLVIANNLLDWGWFPWLTDRLEEVLPIVNVSIAASIAVNAAYIAYDPPWFKSVAEIGLLIVSMVATVRMLQVFPFDFSAYDFAWDTLVRWVLGVAIFGQGVAMVVHLGKLGRAAADASGRERPGA